MNLGSTSITALYLGSTAIATAYLGSTEVYTTGGAFSPASLFASGEEGAWYEPSTTTAFSDLEGFNFATYGQGVAHLVDKSKGATIEARRNLLEYTEQFDNAAWTKTNLLPFGSGSIANATAAPDGTTTADLLVPTLTNTVHYVRRAITTSASTDYTLSCYVAAAGYSKVRLQNISLTGPNEYFEANFDLVAESVISSQAQNGGTLTGSPTITNVGNGFYRISVTGSIGSKTDSGWTLYVLDDSGNVTFTGNGTSGIYIWGAQLEVGSTATAYQKITTGQTISWLPGNHATQVTAGARPILARVPEGGRRNLLIYSEDQSNAIWTKTGVNLSGSETDPLGGVEAEKLTPVTTSTSHRTINNQTYTASAGQGVVHSCYIKAAGYSKVALRESAATGAYASFDLATESVLDTGNAGSIVVSGATITNVGSGWYRISMVCTNASGAQANGFALWFLAPAYTTGSPTTAWAGDGTSGMLVWGAQLETGSTATAYQKVVSSYDITEAGVTSLEYLSFDGADDGMATATIDFTATDKMSVFAGVEKESDAAQGVLAELTAVSTTPGAFSLFAGNTTTTRRWAWSVASLQNFIGTADLPAPATAVMSAIMDRSAATTVEKLGPRLNGSTPTISETVAAGISGTFANDSLNIGARNAASVWFNGKIFGLIVRGAASTAQEISNTEAYLANRSGVTL